MKKKMVRIAIGLSMAFILPVASQAGPKDNMKTQAARRGGDNSGGGDVLICRYGLFGGRKVVYLADTFDVRRHLNFSSIGNVEYYLRISLDLIFRENAEMARKLKDALDKLSFIPEDDVTELDDDFIEVNQSNCRKKQLAQQDISTAVVKYNRHLYMQLSDLEKALFRIHEAYIFVRNQPMKDTTEIRRAVEQVLHKYTSKKQEFLHDICLNPAGGPLVLVSPSLSENVMPLFFTLKLYDHEGLNPKTLQKSATTETKVDAYLVGDAQALVEKVIGLTITKMGPGLFPVFIIQDDQILFIFEQPLKKDFNIVFQFIKLKVCGN